MQALLWVLFLTFIHKNSLDAYSFNKQRQFLVQYDPTHGQFVRINFVWWQEIHAQIFENCLTITMIVYSFLKLLKRKFGENVKSCNLAWCLISLNFFMIWVQSCFLHKSKNESSTRVEETTIWHVFPKGFSFVMPRFRIGGILGFQQLSFYQVQDIWYDFGAV